MMKSSVNLQGTKKSKNLMSSSCLGHDSHETQGQGPGTTKNHERRGQPDLCGTEEPHMYRATGCLVGKVELEMKRNLCSKCRLLVTRVYRLNTFNSY